MTDCSIFVLKYLGFSVDSAPMYFLATRAAAAQLIISFEIIPSFHCGS